MRVPNEGLAAYFLKQRFSKVTTLLEKEWSYFFCSSFTFEEAAWPRVVRETLRVPFLVLVLVMATNWSDLIVSPL